MNWRRSSFCNSVSCLEVAQDETDVLVRDSKDPAATPQRYTRQEWLAFVLAVKAGEFDDLAGGPVV
ncbi:DUF397 domain-containing protein [Kineosporia sp. J2-2]|uniref:DUF397 domain-containing protein n=1 Tax=Kineosporia corallincola TaxID=2835133 RepID=A0ABS5TPA0_9ACTN|nr:DUF397 domain-containing protein [Kineosporia corallincola]MBT0772935.1 DUF397 domain-containing protein [Kineosporia corallincola]